MCEIVIPEIHTFKKLLALGLIKETAQPRENVQQKTESSKIVCNENKNRCKSFATILLYKIKKLLKAMKHEVYERQEE